MIEFCSNLNWNAVTAIISLGLFLVTLWAASSVNVLTKYSHNQKDREVVLNIYNIYCELMREYLANLKYDNSLFSNLHRAIDVAELYALKEIHFFLKNKQELLKKAYEAKSRCYDPKGQPLKTHNAEDIEIEHKILLELTKDYYNNKDMEVFRKRLQIKK